MIQILNQGPNLLPHHIPWNEKKMKKVYRLLHFRIPISLKCLPITVTEDDKPLYVAENIKTLSFLLYTEKIQLIQRRHVQQFAYSGPKVIDTVLPSLPHCHYASHSLKKGAFRLTCDIYPVSLYKGLCAPILSYT